MPDELGDTGDGAKKHVQPDPPAQRPDLDALETSDTRPGTAPAPEGPAAALGSDAEQPIVSRRAVIIPAVIVSAVTGRGRERTDSASAESPPPAGAQVEGAGSGTDTARQGPGAGAQETTGTSATTTDTSAPAAGGEGPAATDTGTAAVPADGTVAVGEAPAESTPSDGGGLAAEIGRASCRERVCNDV